MKITYEYIQKNIFIKQAFLSWFKTHVILKFDCTNQSKTTLAKSVAARQQEVSGAVVYVRGESVSG